MEGKFYHGTNSEAWENIQKEGFLFGKRTIIDGEFERLIPGYNISLCAYLTDDPEEAKCYGEVLLEVEYDPTKNPKDNNYTEGCWQFRVYEPIPLDKIKRIDYE